MQINKKDLKDYIGQDRLEELVEILTKKISLYLSNDKQDKYVSEINDTLMINSGKLKGLMRDQNRGIIGSEDYKITKAQVQMAVLGVINQLPENVIVMEEQDSVETSLIESSENKKDKKTTVNINIRDKKKESEENEQEQKGIQNTDLGQYSGLDTNKSNESNLNKQTINIENHSNEKNPGTKQNLAQTYKSIDKKEKSNQLQQQLKPKPKQTGSTGLNIKSKLSILVSFILVSLFILFKFGWQPWKTKVNGVSKINSDNVLYITGQKFGTFIDIRDAMQYKTVKIGNQVWMAENLAYKPKTGNYWAYNDDESNKTIYGYLYDWETAKRVCPIGWHLPSKEDFETMLKIVGGEGNAAYNTLIKDGNSGFSAQLIGWRINSGAFLNFGNGAHLWSSSPGDNYLTWGLLIDKKASEARLYESFGTFGFSIRCIQDN